MSYGDTSFNKPSQGGLGAIQQSKGADWDKIFDTVGDVIEAGGDIVDFLNGADDDGEVTVDTVKDEGGTKAASNQWDWWNPFSWPKWPWEGDAPTEAEAKNKWYFQWVVVILISIGVIYMFLRVFKGSNNSKW